MMIGRKFHSNIKSTAAIIITSYLLIALFAPLIANDKPLYVSFENKNYFPAFSTAPYIDVPFEGEMKKVRVNSIDWKNIRNAEIIFAPIPWSPVKTDLLNIFSSPFSEQKIFLNGGKEAMPFRYRHFLGTGKTGNDVLAGLIHGTRTSVLIGVLSTLLSLLIGVFLGGLAGYFGDQKIKINLLNLILSIFLFVPAWFYSFHLRNPILTNAFQHSALYGTFQLFLSMIFFAAIAGAPFLIPFNKLSIFNKEIFLPVDSIISRIIEIFISIPRLILILTIAALTHPSIASIILIIGFTSWTEIARITRAQVLSFREQNFIDAARVTGQTNFRIIFMHIIPNTISQIRFIAILSIASAILVETGLSFLGIGIPAATPSWGSLMYEGRENFQAWWIVLFTGLAIFLLLSSLYSISNKFNTRSNKVVAYS